MSAEPAAASGQIPVVHSLSDIYSDAVRAQQRYTALTARFAAVYQRPPIFYARAPGRVNLIGEHIDYCGYSVLPMAIERDTIIAAAICDDPLLAPSDDHPVQVANYDPAYPAVTYDGRQQLFAVQAAHSWTKYVQCGFKGVFNDRKAHGDTSVLLNSPAASAAAPASAAAWDDECTEYRHHSLQLMVSGTVPPSAGLSSSSSLVCASALTAAFAHSLLPSLPAAALATVAAQCERYVGTMGGGMDQAISFLSQRGVAQRIDFDPLHASPVSLPSNAVFLVCNSLYESEKAVQAARQFNARVLECKLAALLLAQHFGVAVAAGEVRTFVLRTVQERSKHSTAQLVSLLSSSTAILHSEPYSVAEVEGILGVQLSAYLAYNANFARVLASGPSLYLRQRALHVYSEAQRVFDFQSTCAHPSADTVHVLGRLMDASHASCRDEYDCSCDDLERLVAAVKAAGALGCRLTGAGWGGCVVALFDASRGEHAVDEAQQQIRQSYYTAYKGIAADDPRLSEFMFTSQPASGAAVYVPERAGVSGQALAAKVAEGEAAAVAAVEGEVAGMSLWKRTAAMVGLGLLTGAVIALLTRRHNQRLAQATTAATSHSVVSGVLGSAVAPAPSMPVLR